MIQLSVDFARPADDAAIRRLLAREPMPGRITVTFEREPDFSLGCAIIGDDCRILVARSGQDNEVVGVACRSTRSVFFNGRQVRLGYLGQLRVDERYRGRWLLSYGFRLLRHLHEADPVPAYLAAIIGGNDQATAVLVEKRRRLFPAFHPVADYCTLAIDVHRAKPPLTCRAQISSGRPNDLAELVEFLQIHGPRRQFFPVWTEESLLRLAPFGLSMEDVQIARRKGQIVGACALWDQSAFKQTIVRGYSGWLRAAAPVWNASAPLFGRTPLPNPGEKLRHAYAALICVAEDDIQVFAALLRAVYNLAHARGFSYLMVGLDARDPLLPAARAYGHVLYSSRFYLAEWPDGGHLHEQLDQRPAYVEIATL